MLRGMFFGVSYVAFAAVLGAAAPHAWERAQPAVAQAGVQVALTLGLERQPEARPEPGTFTATEAVELAPIFAAEGGSYAPPDGFDRHVSEDGLVWHVAAGAEAGPEAPAILLLHGEGADGRGMLDMWSDLAEAEGLVLIAPDAGSEGWAERDAPRLAALLDEAGAVRPFDRARVYLVGTGAGGDHALRLAGRGPGPWRAVAVHAGSVDAAALRPHAGAAPLRLQIGTEDAERPLDRVRAGAWALAQAGHDVDLAVIPRHGHWYYEIGPRLAADAWAFLSRH